MPDPTKRRRRNRDIGGALAKKRPGPKETHGAFSDAVVERYSDLRTKEGKRLEAVTQGLISDLGGAENISTAQSIIIDTIRSKLIVLFQISTYADKQINVIDKESGKLIPCLGKSFISYSEALRRDLESLQKFSVKQLPGDLYEKWRAEFFKDVKEGQ